MALHFMLKLGRHQQPEKRIKAGVHPQFAEFDNKSAWHGLLPGQTVIFASQREG
jgi:hypothetical protein